MIIRLAVLAALSSAAATAAAQSPAAPSAPPPPMTITLPPAPPGSPAAIVDAQMAAYNSGDVEAFAAFFADDVEFYDLGPDNPMIMQGKAALIRRYKPAIEKHRPRMRLLNRIVDGRFVINREQVSAGANNNSGAAIYEVVDGKIARVWFTPAVLRLRPK